MDNETMKTIGKRINAALAEKDVKQKELAEYLGVKDNTVSYWCSGKRTPNTEQIIKISKRLDVSADYLLGLSEPKTRDDDLKFVCEYTELSEEAVKTLRECKALEAGFDFELIEFISSFIPYAYNTNILSTLTDLRSDTSILNDLYYFDDECSLEELKAQKEEADDLETLINGMKYSISRFFGEFIDNYSVSFIENFDYFDLIQNKQSFFMKIMEENNNEEH